MKKPLKLALGSPFVLALLLLTVVPIGLVIYRSVFTPDGATLQYYREAFGRSASIRSVLNTLLISVGTVIFATLLAVPSAWLIARTDLPGHRRFRFLLLLPYVIPPYLGAIAWINLCNPTVGWLNRLLGAAVFDIYTTWGIVWVLGLFFYTFIYLNCLAAMENADPSFEEAARMCGASPLRVLFTITLPLIRPAIFAGAFLVFAASAASFGVPYLIGIPGRVQVMTTQIYNSVKSGVIGGQYEAAALSSLLLAGAIAAALVADRLAKSGPITSLTGKAARFSRVRLERWKWPAFGLVAGLFTVACLLPLTAIALTSFMKIAGRFELENLTLAKYRYVLFERPGTIQSFLRSLGLGLGAATMAVAIGTALAYMKGHARIRSSRLLNLCIDIPYATPGTILAFGLILLWSRPIRLTDTLWILLLAYFAKYLAFAVRAITTNVEQVDLSLEEAARVSGAGFLTTFRTIWLPLLRPGMLASWFLVFMPAFSELTMSVLLVGPGTETVGTTLFNLQQYADPPAASVMAVLILILILGAYFTAIWIAPRKAEL